MERRADRAAGRGAIAPEGGETPGLRGDPRERVIRNGSGAFDGTRRNAGLATAGRDQYRVSRGRERSGRPFAIGAGITGGTGARGLPNAGCP